MESFGQLTSHSADQNQGRKSAYSLSIFCVRISLPLCLFLSFSLCLHVQFVQEFDKGPRSLESFEQLEAHSPQGRRKIRRWGRSSFVGDTAGTSARQLSRKREASV